MLFLRKRWKLLVKYYNMEFATILLVSAFYDLGFTHVVVKALNYHRFQISVNCFEKSLIQNFRNALTDHLNLQLLGALMLQYIIIFFGWNKLK